MTSDPLRSAPLRKLEGKLVGKRITQLIPALTVGGVERVALALVERCLSQGAEVALIAGDGPLRSELEVLQRTTGQQLTWIDASLAKKSISALLTHRHAVAQHLNSFRPDIVHAHSRLPAWSYLSARAFSARTSTSAKRLKSLYTVHADHAEKSRLKRGYNRVYTHFDRCMTISDYLNQRVDHPNKVLIPIGPDTVLFGKPPTSSADTHAFRTRHGIALDEVLILAPNRVSKFYDFAAMIRGVTHWASEAQNRGDERSAATLLCGPATAEQRERLKALNRELGEAIGLSFLERDVDRVMMYDAADAIISLSKNAPSFGLSVAEAFVRKRPVISTNLGGTTELMDSALARALGARSIDENSEETVATALQKLLSSGAEKYDALDNEMTAFTSQYSLDSFLDKTMELYASM